MSLTKDLATQHALHCICFDAEEKQDFEACVDSDSGLYVEINLHDAGVRVKDMTIPKSVAIKLRDFLNYAYPKGKDYE